MVKMRDEGRWLRDADSDESPFRPLASETLVWQAGITRFQSQGVKTREP
jgi:hypothetical protein